MSPARDSEVGGGFIANLAEDEHLQVPGAGDGGGAGEVEADGFVDFGLHRAGNDLLDRSSTVMMWRPPSSARWRRQA